MNHVWAEALQKVGVSRADVSPPGRERLKVELLDRQVVRQRAVEVVIVERPDHELDIDAGAQRGGEVDEEALRTAFAEVRDEIEHPERSRLTRHGKCS